MKRCTRCGDIKPEKRDYFGSTPSGNLRGYCRTCMNDASRKYEENNKEGRRERDDTRSKAHKDARKPFDKAIKQKLFRKQGGWCPCCFELIEFLSDAEVDHINPLIKGGDHSEANFILTHARCNREKHNKSLVEHWEWRVRVGLDTVNLGRKHGLIS